MIAAAFLTFAPLLWENQAISAYCAEHGLRHALPQVLDASEAVETASLDFPLSSPDRADLRRMLREGLAQEMRDATLLRMRVLLALKTLDLELPADERMIVCGGIPEPIFMGDDSEAEKLALQRLCYLRARLPSADEQEFLRRELG
jgi:hypothetical protein